MDPTANYAEQLRLAPQLIDTEDPPAVIQQRTERLAELVLALNHWMLNGGFPPAQWRAAERDANVSRIVEAATSHITGDDASQLDNETAEALPFDAIDQGYLVFVAEDEKVRTSTATGLSPAFLTLLHYTAARGCCWLKLDADASEIPNLPTFAW